MLKNKHKETEPNWYIKLTGNTAIKTKTSGSQTDLGGTTQCY